MKLNKFFMLAMAGLAMTACSNDDEMGNNLSGNGVVEVKIVAPQSRALETPDASTDNKVTVEGDIYVKLTADQGGDNEKGYCRWRSLHCEILQRTKVIKN